MSGHPQIKEKGNKIIAPIPLPELTKSDIDKFWNKVAITANDERCWNWVGVKDKDGYGLFYLGDNNKKAHRVSFFIKNKVQLGGLFCLHRCDNPSCVNPNHLFLGTVLDNAKDREQKKRGMPAHKRWWRANPNATKGENNVKAKLTREQVLEIREIHLSGKLNGIGLAKKYSVNASTISSIILKKLWKHI